MRRLIASALFAVFVSAGCHSGQNASQQSSAGQFKVYKLRGRVVSTDAAKGEVTLNHEAIAGFMGAMTMPYKLKDGGWVSIWRDLLFLVVFGITSLLIATPLFKRTL